MRVDAFSHGGVPASAGSGGWRVSHAARAPTSGRGAHFVRVAWRDRARRCPSRARRRADRHCCTATPVFRLCALVLDGAGRADYHNHGGGGEEDRTCRSCLRSAGAQARGSRGRRSAHRTRMVRRRSDRVRFGRAAPVAARARRQTGGSGAALGQTALDRAGRTAASALPLRDDRRIQGAGGAGVTAQVRSTRRPVGLAAAVREDSHPARRRRRARDDRRPPARRILLRDDPEHEPPIAKLGFDLLLAMPPPKRFSEMIRARSANVKVAPPRPVVRGRRGQLDRGRGALPGRDRSPAPSVVIDGRGSAARARQARLDRQARGRRERQ